MKALKCIAEEKGKWSDNVINEEGLRRTGSKPEQSSSQESKHNRTYPEKKLLAVDVIGGQVEGAAELKRRKFSCYMV